MLLPSFGDPCFCDGDRTATPRGIPRWRCASLARQGQQALAVFALAGRDRSGCHGRASQGLCESVGESFQLARGRRGDCRQLDAYARGVRRQEGGHAIDIVKDIWSAVDVGFEKQCVLYLEAHS